MIGPTERKPCRFNLRARARASTWDASASIPAPDRDHGCTVSTRTFARARRDQHGVSVHVSRAKSSYRWAGQSSLPGTPPGPTGSSLDAVTLCLPPIFQSEKLAHCGTYACMHASQYHCVRTVTGATQCYRPCCAAHTWYLVPCRACVLLASPLQSSVHMHAAATPRHPLSTIGGIAGPKKFKSSHLHIRTQHARGGRTVRMTQTRRQCTDELVSIPSNIFQSNAMHDISSPNSELARPKV